MHHLYFLNELNIFQIAIYGLLRRKVYILSAAPYLEFLRRPLGIIGNGLMALGLAKPVEELFLDKKIIDEMPEGDLYNSIAVDVDEAMRRHQLDRDLPAGLEEYRYSIFKIISNLSYESGKALLILEYLHESYPSFASKVNGASRDLPVLFQAFRGRNYPIPIATKFRLGWLANGIYSIASAVYVLAFLVSRVRLKVNREAFLAVIDVWAFYDHGLFDQIADEKDILVLYRNKSHEQRDGERFAKYRTCQAQDGRVTIGRLLRYFGQAIQELALIWALFRNKDEAFFLSVCNTAVKRVVFATLFDRFEPKFLWGRDDYSIDHIIRNRELRKRGGVSIGNNHGLPLATYSHAWKEIDFDIYYVYGTHLYEAYYKPFWPKEMRVKAIGTHHMSLAHRQRMGQSRTKNIVYFLTPRPRGLEFLDEMCKVAERFKDRKVLVQIKPTRREDGSCEKEIQALRYSPPNMVEITDDAYDTLLTVSYSVTSGSTLTAEALQFGAISFVFDMSDEVSNFYFGDFPEMVVKSGTEIIQRIEAIEEGTWTYPIEKFESLINIHGPLIAEQLRKDMGLPLSRINHG